jgi:hypothetical protein
MFTFLLSMRRGRRSAADQIVVKGVDDSVLWEAAQATEGFSGAWI